MKARQWILYASRVAAGVGEQEVADIVRAAQVRNRQRGLTGALLFTGVHFAQVLEGETAQLGPVFDTIMADRRHLDIRVLARDTLTRRRYRQWTLKLVREIGHADFIEDLLQGPEVGIERAQRLSTSLFRS